MAKYGEVDGYPYNYFTDWVETKVIGKRFDEIETEDAFITAVENIRKYCSGNDQGKQIYKRYFNNNPAIPVTAGTIKFEGGVKADTAWRALRERTAKLTGIKEEEGYKKELRDIQEAKTFKDFEREATDLRLRDWKPATIKKTFDYMASQPEFERLPPYQQREIKNKFILEDIRDLQQGQGKYKIGITPSERERMLTEKRRELPPELASQGAPLGEIARRVTAFPEKRRDYASANAYEAAKRNWYRNKGYERLTHLEKFGFTSQDDFRTTKRQVDNYAKSLDEIKSQMPQIAVKQRRVFEREFRLPAKEIETVDDIKQRQKELEAYAIRKKFRVG